MITKTTTKMKKHFLLLILAALLPMVAWADESGQCGDNLTWTYYEATHSLVLTGSGVMENYYPTVNGSEYGSTAPWNKYHNDIVSITLPEGLSSIGNCAFSGFKSATTLTIPNSVTTIGDWAFLSCTGLTTLAIGHGVKTIGKLVFGGCSGLTSVTIGNSVTRIGERSFDGCEGLRSVHISDIEAWCKISFNDKLSNPLSLSHHLFFNGEEIKDLVIPNGVTSISLYAFCGCSSLTSVTIPNTITSIEGLAFENCSGLTAIYISDIAAWCKLRFSYDDYNPLYYAHKLYLNGEEIKDLIIPNNVSTIGNNVFSNCSSLTSVTIGNSVTSVDDGAFNGCI